MMVSLEICDSLQDKRRDSFRPARKILELVSIIREVPSLDEKGICSGSFLPRRSALALTGQEQLKLEVSIYG